MNLDLRSSVFRPKCRGIAQSRCAARRPLCSMSRAAPRHRAFPSHPSGSAEAPLRTGRTRSARLCARQRITRPCLHTVPCNCWQEQNSELSGATVHKRSKPFTDASIFACARNNFTYALCARRLRRRTTTSNSTVLAAAIDVVVLQFLVNRSGSQSVSNEKPTAARLPAGDFGYNRFKSR
jgi:hypothetical protein